MKKILLWLQLEGKTLEWELGGRTFQFSGHPQMAGYWERFFHAGSHPTRRQMSEAEAKKAFRDSDSFLLYSVRKDESGAETLSREQVLSRVAQVFSAR